MSEDTKNINGLVHRSKPLSAYSRKAEVSMHRRKSVRL